MAKETHGELIKKNGCGGYKSDILCVFKEERIRNEIDATGINSTLNGQTAMVVMKRN